MRLYVGNLPHSLTEDEFKALFTKYTSVMSCKLIIDRDTGRSKGFGFVEFQSDDEARQVITDLNGKDVGGRAVVVNEARPQNTERRGSFGGGSGNGGGNGGGGGGFGGGNRRRTR